MERIKRQMMNKKLMILQKEKEHENLISSMKEKESEIRKIKMEMEQQILKDK